MPTHQKAPQLTGCALKLAIGSCAVIALGCLAVWLASKVAWISDRPWAVGLIGATIVVIGIELATVILSPGSSTPFNLLGVGGFFASSKDNSPAALLRRGEATRDEFEITRAILVEDDLASGHAYFCQLANDAGVLLLSGQYLYEFEPNEDSEGSDEETVPRRFPATHISTVRGIEDGRLYHLIPKGRAFEPEQSFPSFPKGLHEKLDQLLDGYVWDDRNLDDIVTLLGNPNT